MSLPGHKQSSPAAGNGDVAREHSRESRQDSIMAESGSGFNLVSFFPIRSFRERLKMYFINNQSSSLSIRAFNLFIKLLSCILYVVRVLLDHDNSHSASQISPSVKRALTNIFESICYENETQLPPDTSAFTLPLAQFHHNASKNQSDINWNRLIFVQDNDAVWAIQLIVAVISLSQMLMLLYLEYKGYILQQILSISFFLEIINDVPFIVTIFYEEWRKIFVPVFLNCWLAKITLENILNDLHRTSPKSRSVFSQFLLILLATLACFIFTSVCGLQHLQRGSGSRPFSLFDSLWFVIVTFSTVGYGDICPDIWPSKLFVMFTVITAITVLPRQFEQLGSAWLDSQKQGGYYSRRRAHNERHVVVVVTTLQADTILDFLSEFYAHHKLQDFFVVLLSPCELDTAMKSVLQVPMWAARVVYVRGSALRDADLSRCRMQDAEACFMIAARNYTDKNAADQHTILRSWAVKDFAPNCPQYVQIYRPENKFHVKFAEHVVCEDEFKYALLANNCLFPGISTLVTLLLHTSRGEEGQTAEQEWMKLYGKYSGNEVYHVRLDQSMFFKDYAGKSFTFTSCHVHRKYGVALIGIQREEPGASIQLNPGEGHVMQGSDTCFYLSVNDEQSAHFIKPQEVDETLFKRFSRRLSLPQTSHARPTRTPSAGTRGSQGRRVIKKDSNGEALSPPPADNTQSDTAEMTSLLSLKDTRRSLEKMGSVRALGHGTRSQYNKQVSLPQQSPSTESPDSNQPISSGQEAMLDILVQAVAASSEDGCSTVIDYPPVTPYIGTSPTKCHLMRVQRPHCCLQLAQACDHCIYRHAREYNWMNRAIIIASDTASQGLYNFIVPLRSYVRSRQSLNPIVLLLGATPALSFLETICHFPDVYWMKGSIESLDDLLCAGINFADNVIVVNKESSNSDGEDILADCNTIVAVQTIYRLFPNANIITELSQASNMRFMQFRANKDKLSESIARLEKKEHIRGSQLYYMFRLAFAAGNVLSASMLDTLLYQAFVKNFLIDFVRLLLGIDQAPGSGHLSCIKISEHDKSSTETYGHLYYRISSDTGDIPIGIYRTDNRFTSADLSSPGTTGGRCTPPGCERKEISRTVYSRMSSLGLPFHDYNDERYKHDSISYILINPAFHEKLQADDIIYVLRPGAAAVSIPSVSIDVPSELESELAFTFPDDDAPTFTAGIAESSSRKTGLLLPIA